jgi:hypothetical protein
MCSGSVDNKKPLGGEVNKNYTVEKVAWKSGVLFVYYYYYYFYFIKYTY